MAISPHALTPVLATAGIAWIYYRRIRRSFGRQRWRPKATVFRLVLLTIAALAIVSAAIFVPYTAPGIVIGTVAGATLGVLALRHTHVACENGVRTYHPNPWIGGLLSVLLVGRLAWRFGSGGLAAVAGASGSAQNASPLTLGIAATLVAYSLVNGAGLVRRMRALAIAQKESAGP
jgi:hypothetical protein